MEAADMGKHSEYSKWPPLCLLDLLKPLTKQAHWMQAHKVQCKKFVWQSKFKDYDLALFLSQLLQSRASMHSGHH